jgi:hypothetical protein
LKRRSSTPQEDLSHLTTEQTNRASTDLDLKSALEVVRVINAEDAKVVVAVQRALPQIARGVGLIANALQRADADLCRRGHQRTDCRPRCGGVSSHV